MPTGGVESIKGAWPALLVGPAMLTWALVLSHRTDEFVANSNLTLATVVDVIEHPPTGEGWNFCYLELEFPVEGRNVSARAEAGGHYDEVDTECGELGAVHEIRFDRRDPSQARLTARLSSGVDQLWVMGGFLSLFPLGAACLWLATWWYEKNGTAVPASQDGP